MGEKPSGLRLCSLLWRGAVAENICMNPAELATDFSEKPYIVIWGGAPGLRPGNGCSLPENYAKADVPSTQWRRPAKLHAL
jgi:hypothetical protein